MQYWFKKREHSPYYLSNFWWEWLSKPTHLSAAFKRVANSVDLKVLSQQFEAPSKDEAQYLSIRPFEEVFLRQVYIYGDDKRFEYARVLIPKETYYVHFNEFKNLGSSFIGEKLLYANTKAPRSQFEYTALKPTDTRFQIALKGEGFNRCKVIWARRSLFHLEHYPLAIIEIFIPHLPFFKPEEDLS